MSAPIVIRCDHCKKELQIPAVYAGQTMKCPLCGGLVEVPKVAIVEAKKNEQE